MLIHHKMSTHEPGAVSLAFFSLILTNVHLTSVYISTWQTSSSRLIPPTRLIVNISFYRDVLTLLLTKYAYL